MTDYINPAHIYPDGKCGNPQKLLDDKAGSETATKQERTGCWHCWNIEAHGIAWVIGVKDKKGIRMNTPADIPYNHCPACGRKLEVDA